MATLILFSVSIFASIVPVAVIAPTPILVIPLIVAFNEIVRVSVALTTALILLAPTTFRVSPPEIACVVELESLKVNDEVAPNASFIAATREPLADVFKLAKSPVSVA